MAQRTTPKKPRKTKCGFCWNGKVWVLINGQKFQDECINCHGTGFAPQTV